jgi:hypothetical protein
MVAVRFARDLRERTSSLSFRMTHNPVRIWLLVVGAAMGCGHDDPAGGPDAPRPPDARPPDARPPDARPEDPPPCAPFESSPPGATVVDVHSPPTPTVKLRSSNFLQQPSGTRMFQEWFGEMENLGSVTQCFVLADVTLRDAGGATLATFRGIASGSPHNTGSSVSGACIRPSERVPMYANNFAPAPVSLPSITTVAIAFDLFELPTAVPHPHAPMVTAQIVKLPTTGYDIEGTMTGVGGAIHNISIDAFPRTSCGLVLDRLFDTQLGTLGAGATLPIATTRLDTEFTDYRLYTEFIDGPGVLAPAPALPGPAAEHRRVRDELARRGATHRAAIGR